MGRARISRLGRGPASTRGVGSAGLWWATGSGTALSSLHHVGGRFFPLSPSRTPRHKRHGGGRIRRSPESPVKRRAASATQPSGRRRRRFRAPRQLRQAIQSSCGGSHDSPVDRTGPEQSPKRSRGSRPHSSARARGQLRRCASSSRSTAPGMRPGPDERSFAPRYRDSSTSPCPPRLRSRRREVRWVRRTGGQLSLDAGRMVWGSHRFGFR